ncbi:MAG: signal peptidase I [Pseudomonadales bacterium]|jgi:signal peptidase I|nr:signal peptidase I [Pseudomonadales bacterium]MCP5319996.1 signal peptidase I [Pseudomonadales bacterium]MCP5338257.1 signal peptidase I [Pseudomonadales bacterium]
MDIDFPLILVTLTGLALVIRVLDALLWRPRRKRREADLQARLPAWNQQGSPDAIAYAAQAGSELRVPATVEYARSFLPVLLIVLVLRSFLVEPFQIPSSSMVPTLLVGDYILVNKYAYGIRLPVLNTKVIDIGEPQRGDVMVFFPPNDHRYFIKRVIGLPGDHIVYRDKVLYVNGEEMPQTLIAQLPPLAPTYQILEENLASVTHVVRKDLRRHIPDNFETTVSPGHYFMMGDNRDNSSDSRVWGEVPERNIVGNAFAIWMHWEGLLSLPSFSRMGAIQ